jgi:hypothetical protein
MRRRPPPIKMKVATWGAIKLIKPMPIPMAADTWMTRRSSLSSPFSSIDEDPLEMLANSWGVAEDEGEDEAEEDELASSPMPPLDLDLEWSLLL